MTDHTVNLPAGTHAARERTDGSGAAHGATPTHYRWRAHRAVWRPYSRSWRRASVPGSSIKRCSPDG
jgi:hypothetical protein